MVAEAFRETTSRSCATSATQLPVLNPSNWSSRMLRVIFCSPMPETVAGRQRWSIPPETIVTNPLYEKAAREPNGRARRRLSG